MTGCVFDIQRFSVHDGPGIRTTVFLKGCPLHCRWCSNPESQRVTPELLLNPELCIGCGECAEACPTGATGKNEFDRKCCTGCGACAEVCFAEARTIKGREMTPEAVVEVVRKDRSFYGRTDGGVTFSGGEPLGQIDFLEQTLRLCKAEKINTAIETCGCAPWENLQRAALLSDVFLYDIKHLDDEIHRAFTGAPCSPILENCRRLVKVARQVIIRVPVIPQFNFDEETMTRIVRFAEALGVLEVDFLPFHRLAANKYRYLGRTYWNPGIDRLTAEEVQAVTGKIQTPLKIKIGG